MERTKMHVILEGGDIQGLSLLEDFNLDGKKKESINLGDLKNKYFGLWGDIETYLNKGIGNERNKRMKEVAKMLQKNKKDQQREKTDKEPIFFSIPGIHD